MRIKRLNSYLFGCVCLPLIAYSSSATAIPVQELLDKMQDNPATTASQYEEQRLGAELNQRKESTGWSLFGGADTGRYRDLEKSGMQKYTGSGAQLGLRYPLLGAMQSRREAVINAEIAKDQARHSAALTYAEQQQQLRQTYIDWWKQEATANWCSIYLPIADTEQKSVAKRAELQQLRTSEKLWVEQHWRNLMRQCTDTAQQDSYLRQQLAYLYGDIIPRSAKPQSEPLPTQLASLEEWLPIIEQHPALQTHRAEEQGLQPLTQNRWTDRVDANFTISQRYESRRDINGSGGGTVAAINFEVPLASLTGANRSNPTHSRQAVARQRTQDTRHNLIKILEQTLMQYQQRLDYIAERSLQQKRMQQVLLEQNARLNIDTEGGFMNMRLAQIEKAEVEQDLISDWHAAWSVLAQLQVLTKDLPTAGQSSALNWASQPPLKTQSSVKKILPVLPAQSWTTAAYVWDSAALLDKKQQSEQIESLMQAGFNHIYLGFTPAQVNDLGLLAPEITQLLSQLKQRGFTVDLLLGDPLWLKDEHRNTMLQLIDKFAAQPFDHLHLDLEVEQLGWPVPESRLQDWLQTLEAATKRSPWPVTLVSHHRWFAPDQRLSSTCIPCALPKLNISGATLMLYSTAEQSVIERTSLILAAWPELKLHLAQSIEADLPVENSWRNSTAAELRTLNTRFHDQLKSQGLAGIAWQDWAHYPRPSTEKKQP